MFSRHLFFSCLLLIPCIGLTHPALIGEYPERFPGKTLQQIRDEWEPAPEDAWTEADLLSEARALVDAWTTLLEAERKARVGKLVAENRRGDYRKRFANLAHDMDDLTGADNAEAKSYLDWRMDHLNEDDGFFEDQPRGAWDETPAQKTEREKAWAERRHQEVREITLRAETAGGSLKPHWLVQAGAVEFRHRRYRESETSFQHVLDVFPQHPRSEVAALMLARLRWEEWRQTAGHPLRDDKKLHELQTAWWRAAQLYRDKYPQGRFLIDLYGWEAGYYLTSGSPEMAMQFFLAQTRDSAHPEVRRRAFQQIEWMLRDLVEVSDLPWDEIAKEPLVALRMGYHLMDSRSQVDLGALMQRRSGEDHRVLETLVPDLAAVRKRAREAWLSLDAALDRQAETYGGRFAPVRQVLHAWSLISRGHASVALGVEETEEDSPAADDLALTRLFAWIKAGRHAEAVRSIEAFQAKYTNSPLNRGLTLRCVDAWVELGQIETALPLLWDMLEGRDAATLHGGIDERPALHLPGEVTQRATAILSFAPLDRLARAADAAKNRPLLSAALCGALRTRHLSRGEFDQSLAYASEADFEGWQDGNYSEDAAAKSTRWREVASKLKQLTQAAKDAASWEVLGLEWRKHPRLLDGGVVHLPQPYFVASLGAPAHELRVLASYLHIPDSGAAKMLDERHALTHVRACFERAGSLAELNDSLCERAEISPYWMDRAVEIGDAALSKKLVAQLQRPEIVPWTFRPATTLGVWKPGRSALWQVEIEIATALGSITEGFWEHSAALKRLQGEVKSLATGAEALSEVNKQLAHLRETVKHEAPVLKAAALLNHIDDLRLLAAQPGVGRDAFGRYAALRLDHQPVPADDPAFASMKDFVNFWNAVSTPSETNHEENGWRQRSAEAQMKRMQAFLADFPKSVKREAALARLAVNTLRMTRCHCGLKWDESGYAAFVIERGSPFDGARVRDAITQYESEFIQGRYLPEMRLLRGLTAAEDEDWKTALGYLVPLLNDPALRDLHLDASNTTASIFMLLMQSERRLEVKSAIEAVPGAKEKLRAFLRTPSCAWRLRLIEDWLDSWIRD
ncbi:MAG: hypothetical protein IPK22_06095 [Verrucomicrobiaceae bacterium]|nr:hypothetical protein [Verrucomicrobiaceae bacterium]